MENNRNNSMAVAAFVFAILSALSFWTLGAGSIFAGLGLAFALLSRGAGKIESLAKAALIICIIVCVIRLVLMAGFIAVFYSFFGSLIHSLNIGAISPEEFLRAFPAVVRDMLGSFGVSLSV